MTAGIAAFRAKTPHPPGARSGTATMMAAKVGRRAGVRSHEAIRSAVRPQRLPGSPGITPPKSMLLPCLWMTHPDACITISMPSKRPDWTLPSLPRPGPKSLKPPKKSVAAVRVRTGCHLPGTAQIQLENLGPWHNVPFGPRPTVSAAWMRATSRSYVRHIRRLGHWQKDSLHLRRPDRSRQCQVQHGGGGVVHSLLRQLRRIQDPAHSSSGPPCSPTGRIRRALRQNTIIGGASLWC